MKMKPRYKLFQGDCLEILPNFPDKCFDLILVDVPYQMTACHWDSIIPLDKMWIQLKRLIKNNAAIVMTASQPFTTTLISSNMKMFKYTWVWDKVKPANFATAKYTPLRSTEDVVVFGKGRVNYFPIMIDRDKVKVRKSFTASDSAPLAYHDGKERVYAQRYPKNLIKFSNANQRERYHPTQKPVALMEYLIKTYTNENDLVCDFCFGSNTTGVACMNLNRKFVGIEKDKKYFKSGKERIMKSISEKGNLTKTFM